MTDDPAAAFKTVFDQSLREFCDARHLDARLARWPEEVWAADDIEPFLRSLALFESLGRGVFRWPRGHSKVALFGHGPRGASPRPPTLARETIAVMGAVADLHQRLRWPRDLIEVETAAYVFDFAAYEADPLGERMIIAGEAKSSAAEAQSWLQLLQACIAMPSHEATAHLGGKPLNAHKKRAGLDADRPAYLWLVAVGFRRCFRISYGGGAITLTEAGRLPLVYDVATGP